MNSIVQNLSYLGVTPRGASYLHQKAVKEAVFLGLLLYYATYGRCI